MQKKFIEALDKVVTEKKPPFKSISALCKAIGYDRSGLTRFWNTRKNGEDSQKQAKNDLNLTTVSKVVDVLGGYLVFPWDKESTESHIEIVKLKTELETVKKEREILKRKLSECIAVRKELRSMLDDRTGVQPEMPAESRQDKSSVS